VGIVERKGGWHYHDAFPDGKILGNKAVTDFLKSNEDIRKELSTATLKLMQSGEIDMSEIVPMSADAEESLTIPGERRPLTMSDIKAVAESGS
jgi:hypothetical protein